MGEGIVALPAWSELPVAERVTSCDLMVALVVALASGGIALSLSSATIRLQ